LLVRNTAEEEDMLHTNEASKTYNTQSKI
jgi:hypothetical protein